MRHRSLVWDFTFLACYIVLAAAFIYVKLPQDAPASRSGHVLAASSISYNDSPDMPSLRAISGSVNSLRNSYGAPSLSLSSELSQVAQLRADDMARRTYFAHKNPDGKFYYDALRTMGISYTYSCENLALEPVILTETYVNAWLTSTTGHRECMLYPTTSAAGYGVARVTFGTPDLSDDEFVVVAIYTQD